MWLLRELPFYMARAKPQVSFTLIKAIVSNELNLNFLFYLCLHGV